tara:strand:- start:15 stop:422 length:408 start_codon:yes stop_codon:yes gene_type:complete
MSQNLLEEYTIFVDKITSESSKSTKKMKERIDFINSSGVEVSRLLTAGIGLSGEVGEFNEIIKKTIFQSKSFDSETHEHFKRELGDIMWYVTQACLALKVDLVEVIKTNEEKLKKRFPKERFTKESDANRHGEDI